MNIIKNIFLLMILFFALFIFLWTLHIIDESYTYYSCWFTKQEISFLEQQEKTTNLKILWDLKRKCKKNTIELNKEYLKEKLLNFWFNLYF